MVSNSMTKAVAPAKMEASEPQQRDDGYDTQPTVPTPPLAAETAVYPRQWPWCGFHALGPNVANTLWYTLLAGTYCIWAALSPDAFTFLPKHCHTAGVLGLLYSFSQMIAALVVGFLADRGTRERYIRLSVVFGAASGGLLLCTGLTGLFTLMWVSVVIGGLYVGAATTCVEALLADSVPQGRRAAVYSTKWVMEACSGSAGFVVSVVAYCLYVFLWRDSVVVVSFIAFLLGTGVNCAALVPLSRLTDACALPQPQQQQQQHVSTEEASGTVMSAAACMEAAEDDNTDLPTYAKAASAPLAHDALQQAAAAAAEVAALPRGPGASLYISSSYFSIFGLCSHSAVPFWLCASELVLAVTIGVAVPNYRALLSVEQQMSVYYGFIFGAVPLGVALLSTVLALAVMYVSGHRLLLVMITRLLGVVLLFAALGYPRSEEENDYPILPAFLCIFHFALLDSATGVLRSVMMDCADSGSRAKWCAFATVTGFVRLMSCTLATSSTFDFCYRERLTGVGVAQLLAVVLLFPAMLGARAVEREHGTERVAVDEWTAPGI